MIWQLLGMAGHFALLGFLAGLVVSVIVAGLQELIERYRHARGR